MKKILISMVCLSSTVTQNMYSMFERPFDFDNEPEHIHKSGRSKYPNYLTMLDFYQTLKNTTGSNISPAKVKSSLKCNTL